MLFLAYVTGAVLIVFFSRRVSAALSGLLLAAYSYLALVLYMSVEGFFGGVDSLGAAFNVILQAMYDAVPTMGFEGDLGGNTDPQVAFLFLASGCSTVYAAFMLIFRKTVKRIRAWWRVKLAKRVYLLCGNGGAARALIADIQRELPGAAIAWLPDQETEEAPDWVRKIKKETLAKLNAKKEYHVVLLPREDHENWGMLTQMDEWGKTHPNLHVTAFLEEDLLRLQDLHLEHLDAYLVSEEQLLMRNFINDHLPLQLLKDRGLGKERDGIFVPDRPFTLGMIGFGELSQEYLLTVYENTAFWTAEGPGHGLKARILEQEEDQKADFLRDYPQLGRESGLTWKLAPVHTETFYAELEEKLDEFDQIFIDVDDTDTNVEIALRLLRLCKRKGLGDRMPKLAVVLHRQATGSAALLEHEDHVSLLHAGNGLLTYDAVVLRAVDRKAQEIHERYSRKDKKKKIDWSRVGTFIQNSNRAVIWDISNKLLLIGNYAGKTEEERQEIYWKLAEYEHRRWNAFHYAHGWDRLPLEELTEEEKENFTTKHAEEKRHICLVDWETLDALPQKKPGLIKRYDYENVIDLFE